MFSIVRIIICVLILALVYFLFEHILKNKNLCIVLSCVVFVIALFVLPFIPFENLLFDFNSPEAAYRYYNSDYEAKLVVSGQTSDLVVGNKRGNTYNHLIFPRSEKGWHIGIGLDTKRIIKFRQDNLYIDVYQYKDTDDYYISIYDLYGNQLDVADVNLSEFVETIEVDETSGEEKYFYYANINEINENYYISVNGLVVAINL